jgi:hypothetical protein
VDESIGKFTNGQDKEKNQEIQVESSEPVTIEEQLFIDDQIPLKDNGLNKRKSSAASESVEKAFMAEQISLERSSPPSFTNEDTNTFISEIEQNQSLGQQLHMREPLVIHEKQEAVQHATDFKAPTVAKKVADGVVIPDTDAMAINKSIASGKPAMLVDEVLNYLN